MMIKSKQHTTDWFNNVHRSTIVADIEFAVSKLDTTQPVVPPTSNFYQQQYQCYLAQHSKSSKKIRRNIHNVDTRALINYSPVEYRNSEYGMRVNREWVTSQLKKMKDMASSRDLPGHVIRGTSVDGVGVPSLYVSKPPGSSRPLGAQQPNQTTNPTNHQTVGADQTHVQDVLREVDRFTQSEYKKFSDQVKDTAESHTPSYRGIGFKKFYYNDNGESVPVIYRSQLARSLRAFQEKRWLPYQTQEPTGSEGSVRQAPKGRPWSSASHYRTGTKYNSRVSSSRLRRPKSTPLVLSQDNNSEKHENHTHKSRYNYDSLTPNVLYELANGQVPESIYGERLVSRTDSDGGSKSGEDEDDVDLRENLGKVSDRSNSDKIGTAERESEDDSDDENIPEPEVDDIKMDKLPNLMLRPEKADALYVPWAKGDPRKYDFDAEFLEQPDYEFKDPLSSQAMNLNLKDLSRSDKTWKDVVSIKPVDSLESKLISRLIEFERLQRRTIDTEKERKLKGTRTLKSRSVAPLANSRNRPDLNCCPDCIQMACIGNCPSKKLPSGVCIFCSEKDCKENCHQTVYESRTRLERSNVESGEVKTKLSKSRTCPTCQLKYSSKIITPVNCRTVFRPKSGYDSGKRPNLPQPRENVSNTPTETDLDKNSNDLDIAFSKMYIVTNEDKSTEKQRPHTAGSGRRYRGRAAILPGKSFFSQRRDSLTDITKEEKIRLAVIATKKRLRSAKKKRPKTAL